MPKATAPIGPPAQRPETDNTKVHARTKQVSLPGRTHRAKAERILQDKAKWREFVDDLPFGPAAEPKEVANVVTFMASDRASYVSGAIVTIDGGFSARPR